MRACRLARAKSLVGGLADADVKSTTMGLLRPGAPKARTPPPAAIGKRHLVSADRPARRPNGQGAGRRERVPPPILDPGTDQGAVGPPIIRPQLSVSIARGSHREPR